MEKLSVIVLTRANSEKLEGCLKSVKNLADELIVLLGEDVANSSAEKLAKKYKAKIIRHDLNKDFAKHRNFALKHVKNDWIFFIDDDERVTSELEGVIANIVKQPGKDRHASPVSRQGGLAMTSTAYAFPRKNIIFGREFKHSGQWPDYVIRLFKKSNLKGYKGKIHEQPEFEGKLEHLKTPLIHLKHDELSSMVEKTNSWSEIEAKLMLDANHPRMNIPRFLTAMWREFFLRMIKQKGFLDGPEGVIYGIYQVFSRFISYAKLWEMQLQAIKS